MGFRNAKTVYCRVSCTTSAEQAVLAFLALESDDGKAYRLFRSDRQIAAATHLSRSTISDARRGLRKAGLLQWKRGGHTHGGVAKANEYFLNLPMSGGVDNVSTDCSQRPSERSKQCPPVGQSSVRESDNAVSACRTEQCPRVGHHQNQSVISIHESAEGLKRQSEPRKVDFGAYGDKLIASIEAQPVSGNTKERMRISVIDEAYRVGCAEGSASRKMLASTINCRDPNECLTVIMDFEDKLKHGYRARKKAAVLNSLLVKLPRKRASAGMTGR